jgi:molybdopterin-guanine dinucleotide biosynthesis protein A
MLTAIIVAGGSSRRMGFDKTFALLGEKPVVAHSIAAFEATDAVQAITSQTFWNAQRISTWSAARWIAKDSTKCKRRKSSHASSSRKLTRK